MHRLNQKSLSAFLWQHLKEHFSKKKKKKNQPWRPNEIKMDYELHSAVSCQRLTRPVVHRAAVPQDVKGQLLISFPPSWKGIISNRVTHQPRLCARVMCITDSEKWSVWNLTPHLPLKRYSVCVCVFVLMCSVRKKEREEGGYSRDQREAKSKGNRLQFQDKSPKICRVEQHLLILPAL